MHDALSDSAVAAPGGIFALPPYARVWLTEGGVGKPPSPDPSPRGGGEVTGLQATGVVVGISTPSPWWGGLGRGGRGLSLNPVAKNR